MKHWLGKLSVAVLALGSFACQSQSDRDARRAAEQRRLESDRGSAAFKSGQVAHEIARKAERAAAAAGRKLNEDARKAREGWKEQERRDREEGRDLRR